MESRDPNYRLRKRLGFSAKQQKGVKEWLKIIYLSKARATHEDASWVAKHVCRDVQITPFRLDWLKRTAKDTQGNMEKMIWGSKQMVKITFETVNAYEKARGPLESPFSELSADEKRGVWRKAFTPDMVIERLACMELLRVDECLALAPFREYFEGMLLVACLAIFTTADFQNRSPEGFPVPNFKKVYKEIRKAPDKLFPDRLPLGHMLLCGEKLVEWGILSSV